MLNLDTGRNGRGGRGRTRIWNRALCAVASTVILIILLPVSSAAQTVTATAPVMPQVPLFNFANQMPLQFAGEAGPGNLASLSFGVSTLYDDNILSENAARLSDEALSFNSDLAVSGRTERLMVKFDYTPFFLLYRQYDQYDRLNHAANFNLTYRLSPHFILGLHDTFSYATGAYPAITEQQILSGPVSPTALNQTIFPYTTRTLSNMPGLDLTFLKSGRTSFSLSGTYNQRRFGSQGGTGVSLYNTAGFSTGLQYQYRVTAHTSFDLALIHEDSTYRGQNGLFGPVQRFQVESAFVSLASRLGPTLNVAVYGGPQYIRSIGPSVTGLKAPDQVQGAGGGSITKQVRNTAFNLSLQRSVSDGGGLYTSVINTNAIFGVRRRLTGRWEANLHGGAGRSDASLFALSNSRSDTAILGIDLTRPLREGDVFHVSYDSMHQLSKGSLAVAPDFDRNQVTVGIDFRVKAVPLAR